MSHEKMKSLEDYRGSKDYSTIKGNYEAFKNSIREYCPLELTEDEVQSLALDMALKIGPKWGHGPTPEFIDEFCLEVSSNFLSINQICAKYPHYPTPNQIKKWLQIHPEFKEKFIQAKRDQALVGIDEAIEDSHIEYYRDNHGVERADPGKIQVAKIRIDLKKWMASKLVSNIFGEEKSVDTKAQELLHDLLERQKALHTLSEY